LRVTAANSVIAWSIESTSRVIRCMSFSPIT
jgi:hypothetical protein